MAKREEMTIGELAEKLSNLGNAYKKMTVSELLKMLSEEMTVGALLDRLESIAGDYYQDAVASIERNRDQNDLTGEDVKIDKGAKQRIAEAVIVGFINHVALYYGGNRGMCVKHLAEELKKNQKARAKSKKK